MYKINQMQDQLNNLKKMIQNSSRVFLLFFMMFLWDVPAIQSFVVTEPATITYYLNIIDFADSFIAIPTSNISGSSTTIASSYLAGRAPIYDVNNMQIGTCSASFLCMQTGDGIFTDISNYLSTDTGMIITWFTPTTLINLEVDSIINAMVTECTVVVTTKVGVAPYFGQTFNLIVSSDNQKIYFKLSRIGTIC